MPRGRVRRDEDYTFLRKYEPTPRTAVSRRKRRREVGASVRDGIIPGVSRRPRSEHRLQQVQEKLRIARATLPWRHALNEGPHAFSSVRIQRC